MSNIYEALEQAQRERTAVEAKEIVAPPKDAQAKVEHLSGKGRERTATRREVDVAALYRNIDVLLPECPRRTIQFISTREGEGVSTIVREMARTAADHLGKKVLVLDAAHHNPTQHKFLNVRVDMSGQDIVQSGGEVDNACFQTGNPNVFFSSIAKSAPSNPYCIDIQASINFLDEVKNKFDLILIDSAPTSVAADSLVLSQYADGVILVLEAERTRWAAVENLRDRIQKNGGTILGVVLNKRRYHIPDRIYRWLYC